MSRWHRNISENTPCYRWGWYDDDGNKQYYSDFYTTIRGAKLGARYHSGGYDFIEVANNWKEV